MPARPCAAALLGVVVAVGAPSAAAPPAAPEIAVRRIQPGTDPHHLVIRDGTLFTSGFHAGRVVALDLLTGKKLGTTALDGYESVVEDELDGKRVTRKVVRPYSGGDIACAGGRLFVGQVFSDFLLAIDPASMRVIRRLPLGGDGKLAVTPDGKTVAYALALKNEFHLIDAETFAHTTVAYAEGGNGIGSVAVSPDGRYVVLGHQRGGQPPGAKEVIEKGNSFLAVYDRAAKKYAATVYLASSAAESVSEFPYALTFAPDGKTLYVGMFQATTGIRVIDTAKWALAGDISFAPNARNKHFPHTNPLGLAFYRGWLFVANRENEEVVVIDPAARSPAARLRFADGAYAFQHLLIEGDRLFVADAEAVYELDGWTLARRLTARKQKGERAPLELVMTVGEE